MRSTYSQTTQKPFHLHFSWKQDGWTILPILFTIVTALTVIGK